MANQLDFSAVLFVYQLIVSRVTIAQKYAVCSDLISDGGQNIIACGPF